MRSTSKVRRCCTSKKKNKRKKSNSRGRTCSRRNRSRYRSSSTAEECVICLENYDAVDHRKCLPYRCNHWYGLNCAINWTTQGENPRKWCALCKARLRPGTFAQPSTFAQVIRMLTSPPPFVVEVWTTRPEEYEQLPPHIYIDPALVSNRNRQRIVDLLLDESSVITTVDGCNIYDNFVLDVADNDIFLTGFSLLLNMIAFSKLEKAPVGTIHTIQLWEGIHGCVEERMLFERVVSMHSDHLTSLHFGTCTYSVAEKYNVSSVLHPLILVQSPPRFVLPNLMQLLLWDVNCNDVDLSHLPRLQKLELVSIDQYDSTRSTLLPSLTKLSTLEYLKLMDMFNLRGSLQVVIDIVRANTALTTVHVNSCSSLFEAEYLLIPTFFSALASREMDSVILKQNGIISVLNDWLETIHDEFVNEEIRLSWEMNDYDLREL